MQHKPESGQAGGLYGGVGDNADGLLGFVGETDEVRHNGLIWEGLSLTEAYYTGKFEICFPFGGCSNMARPSCASVSLGLGQVDVESNVLAQNERGAFVRETGVLGHEFGKIGKHHGPTRCGGDDELVLIGQIEVVDGLKHLVPARIRLEFLYFSHDLFAGAIYLSTVNGGFQSVSRGTEGKLDLSLLSGCWAFVANQRECEQVKRGTQIVDGITDDQGEAAWGGYLVFDDIGNLVGLAVGAAVNSQGALARIGFRLPAKVIDVMFGPFNLSKRTS